MARETTANSASLPHERELFELVSVVKEAYGDSDFVGLVITDNMEQARYLLQTLHASVRWDIHDVKIHRDGVEVKGGGKVIVAPANYPGRLLGVRANKVVLFGNIGELFYWIHSMTDNVKAVA